MKPAAAARRKRLKAALSSWPAADRQRHVLRVERMLRQAGAKP